MGDTGLRITASTHTNQKTKGYGLVTDDPDSQETEDWIELHKSTDLRFDIAGYCLTDDPDDSLRWRVPGGSHDRLQRSLQLNFRSEYGDAKLKTSLIQTGSLYGASATDTFDRLILRGGNNRSWARMWNPIKPLTP